MDINSYRRKIEQSVAKVQSRQSKSRSALRNSAEDLRSAVTDRKVAAKTRAEALGRLTREEGPDAVPQIALERLSDPKESPVVRLAAIKLMQHKQIFSPVAAEWRPAFVEGLRTAVRTPGLRDAALEVLSLFKDRPTQELLLQGIREPRRALVPVPQALRLLSTDIHADVIDAARKMTNLRQMRKNKAAFVEAVRILAADPGSLDKLEEILADDDYAVDARRLAATAISHLAPEFLQRLQGAPQAGTAETGRRRRTAGRSTRSVRAPARPTGVLARHLETLQKIRS